MAEVLLRQLLDEAGRRDIIASSAGSAAIDGAPASEGAYLVALEQGLDLSGHRARLLTQDQAARSDEKELAPLLFRAGFTTSARTSPG